MKRKQLLLGLLMGVSFFFAGNAFAQSASNKIVEVGPDNIGGRVTCLLVDQSDPSHQTIFAGTPTGGLFVRSNDPNRAPYADMWNHVPTVVDGDTVVLPISAMAQADDTTIFIATGDGAYDMGNKFASMSSRGTGIYIFNPVTHRIFRLPFTNVSSNSSAFATVNQIACCNKDGRIYLFAGTRSGLYSWTFENGNWNNADLVNNCIGENITDIVIIPEHKMVYFSAKGMLAGKLYRISDFTSPEAEPLDITSSIHTSTPALRYLLAASSVDPDFVYAMAIGTNGILEGIYSTRNQIVWTLLTTSTVTPFTINAGTQCGAIAVDPYNERRIYVGGSSIWTGQGFVEGSTYQWTKSSSNENEFYTTNYMADVYSNVSFVHSGINQIVSTFQDGSDVPTYYIATNGGVFTSSTGLQTFTSINQGLNNIQVNGLAVATDGTLIAGAADNANLVIESRCAHQSDPYASRPSWYDAHPELNTNHMASVIWHGNGGQVAASRFQQVAPLSRRTLFTSSNYGAARAYADYADYSNTQTWSADSSFLSKLINSQYTVPQVCLWETEHMPQNNASILTAVIDTANFLTRKVNGADTLIRLAPGTQVLPGDKIAVIDRGHADYAVDYTFQQSRTLTGNDTVTFRNPLMSHFYIVAKSIGEAATKGEVYMTWMPTDFRKVWYNGENPGTEMVWAQIYSIKNDSGLELGPVALSNDGNTLIVAVNDPNEQRSMLVRLKGMVNDVDYSRTPAEIKIDLTHGFSRVIQPMTKLVSDTLTFNGSVWIPRRVSSIAFDQREGSNAAVLTFQDCTEGANVLYIADASANNPTFVNKSLPNATLPAYSAAIECTSGDIFVGSADGIWKATAQSFTSSNPTWNSYGSFRGLPVTAICQQTLSMPVRHNTGHTGITEDKYIFARTKYPYALYFGTYGRGIFMDSSYVTNHENEIVSPEDLDINTVAPLASANVTIYPNPATDHAVIQLALSKADNVTLRIFDLTGRLVLTNNLGHIDAGTYSYNFNCQQLPKGMYLVNVISGQSAVTSKLIVR